MTSEAPRFTRQETGLRVLFTVLFVVVVSVIELILGVVILFALVFTLITQQPPGERVRRFANHTLSYLYRILRYLTYNEFAPPFPFADFPSEVEPPARLPAESGVLPVAPAAGTGAREEAEEGFSPLFTGTLAGWRMAGLGQFRVVDGALLETGGGPGILWYTEEEFADFILRVDWRVSSVEDNSGVFLRFPALGNTDPENDWKRAAEEGYEVQIDERGFDPETGTYGSPLHQTGAIYKRAPALTLASLPVGQWNRFEIEARGRTVTVRLNGQQVSSFTGDGDRPLTGHIGLQNHHAGSHVQFRNIRVKRL